MAHTDDPKFLWHDNVIYGLSFDLGEVSRQDYRSDLVFDIDFIAEWHCGASASDVRFLVAPARLTFHAVADLSIVVDQGSSDGRNAMTEWSIDRVIRERLDRSFEYWRWTILLNDPVSGRIGFCSSGFSQNLKSAPIWVADQRLSAGTRALMINAKR